jgi:hypothetical protein
VSDKRDDELPAHLVLHQVGDERVVLNLEEPSSAPGEVLVALLSGDSDGPPPEEAFMRLANAPDHVREQLFALLLGGGGPPSTD